MYWETVATAVGTSTVVSALVAGLFAEPQQQEGDPNENITKEQAKWRDKIRELALDVHKAAMQRNETLLRELRLSLSLNLNPVDAEDTAILNAIDRVSQLEQLDAKMLQEFSDRIALLLKHDWDANTG